MHEFAEDYSAELGRQVTYVPEDVESWNEQYMDTALVAYPHIAEHLKDLTRLVAGGRYGAACVSEQLETLFGARRKLWGGRWRTICPSRSWRPPDRLNGPEQYHDAALKSQAGTPVRCCLGRCRLLLPRSAQKGHDQSRNCDHANLKEGVVSAEKLALNLEEVSFEDPRAARLRDLLNQELLARYATEEEPSLSAAARSALSVLAKEFVANVLVVNSFGHAIGHGALRQLEGEWEVKRVIVDPAARGLGAATQLMAGLEQIAAAAGARRVILQTGGKQPEAEALYRKIGYRQIPAYPPHDTAIPSSVCFEKELEV